MSQVTRLVQNMRCINNSIYTWKAWPFLVCGLSVSHLYILTFSHPSKSLPPLYTYIIWSYVRMNQQQINYTHIHSFIYTYTYLFNIHRETKEPEGNTTFSLRDLKRHRRRAISSIPSMAARSSCLHPRFLMLMLIVSSSSMFHLSAASGLSPGFYDQSCPSVFEIVKSGVESAVQKDPRMAASLLRLHFHDCFVNVSYIHILHICSSHMSFGNLPCWKSMHHSV